MVFLSIAARIKLNVEALNMVESVGNYVRHRRVPVAIKTDGGFVLRYVPAISGESVAHGYQAILAEIAQLKNLKVCDTCKVGVFVKHADKSRLEQHLLKAITGKKAPENSHELEKEIVRGCVVEDVGGFLYADEPPTKRTSRVAFGYIIPVEEYIKAAAIETQFHVRYGLSPEEHIPYNVEVGSAVYGFAAYLDIDGIGYTSMVKREPAIQPNERLIRIEIALKALAQLIGNIDFGAKRTRFMPSWEVISAVAAVSHPLSFHVSSPHAGDYIKRTYERAEKVVEVLKKGDSSIDEKILIYTYPGIDLKSTDKVTVKAVNTFEEMMLKIIEDIISLVKTGGG